jgi:hypothetical protein
MLSRFYATSTLVMFAVGCSATISGQVVDGISQEPISTGAETGEPIRIVAEAVIEKENGAFDPNPSAGLTCQTFSSDISPSGEFKLTGLCLSDTGYRLRLSDPNYFLGEIDFIAQGSDAKQPRTIKAWHAPMGTGVKTLIDGKHGRITSRVTLRTETIKGSDDEKVYYPEGLPGSVPLIGPGASVIITGMANKDLKLVPMFNSGRREFKVEAGMETGPRMDPWVYLGTKFTDDTTFERVAVTLDESKTHRVEHRNHYAKFVPAEAVTPPGRYALWVEGQKQAFVVDFMEAGSNPGQ